MLMAAGVDVPRRSSRTAGCWSAGEKMSKSKATAIAPEEIVEHFGSDAYRYYFTKTIAFGSDGNFSWEHMSAVYTSELANGLGNLASRVTAMVGKYFDGVLPEATAEGDAERALAATLVDGRDPSRRSDRPDRDPRGDRAVGRLRRRRSTVTSPSRSHGRSPRTSPRRDAHGWPRSSTPRPSRCALWLCCTTR